MSVKLRPRKAAPGHQATSASQNSPLESRRLKPDFTAFSSGSKYQTKPLCEMQRSHGKRIYTLLLDLNLNFQIHIPSVTSSRVGSRASLEPA
jgi:hypothetical protein